MRELSGDTTAAAEAFIVEGLKRMPAWRKLQRVTELNQLIQELALADIRRRHPYADGRELSLRLASRWLPPEVLKKGWGWDVEREGF